MPPGITTTTITVTTPVRNELGKVKDILEKCVQRTVTLSETIHVLVETFMRNEES